MPYISCSSYIMPLTNRICFITLAWNSPLSFSNTACVIREFVIPGVWSPSDLSWLTGHASALTARG
uniref:Uncharacterized protein n=1 Tax=Rhizophora mucronata TaxID=61149 RepID=A0A2P2PF63_RHIMU